MKKSLIIILCILLAAGFTGCGAKSVNEDEKASANTQIEDQNKKKTSEDKNLKSENIDLTKMSQTMAYSELFDMTTNPDDYNGKTVKMSGTFKIFHDENTDKDYYACIITDATACCSQGLEFVPDEKYKYPDDFPKDGEEITVTGIFNVYYEERNMYLTLRDTEIL